MQFLSDEIEPITGYPAAEFVGSSVRTFASVIHPDDRELVEHGVGEALERLDAFVLEYRILHGSFGSAGSTSWRCCTCSSPRRPGAVRDIKGLAPVVARHGRVAGRSSCSCPTT